MAEIFVSPYLTKKYARFGYMPLVGGEVQVAIGRVTLLENGIRVQVLPGCSIQGLTATMEEIALETNLPVIATFNNEKILVRPPEEIR